MNFLIIKFAPINSIIQWIKKKLILNNRKDESWKEDFKTISFWENDNFDEVQKGFSKWKIGEF